MNINKQQQPNLHSSMVRLETRNIVYLYYQRIRIYIPVWLDQKLQIQEYIKKHLRNLHSSMVRLETFIVGCKSFFKGLFTFQYGQIRNHSAPISIISDIKIYIPVWLDQKRCILNDLYYDYVNLHSSMVRLETEALYELLEAYRKFTFQYGQIRNFK